MNQGAVQPKAATPTSSSPTDTATDTDRPHRVLHALVPADAYWHARRMAMASGLCFKDYLALLLADAWPYPPRISTAFTQQQRQQHSES